MFLSVIFTLEVAAGIAGYVRYGEVESMLHEKFNETMLEYNNKEEIRKSWNTVQHDVSSFNL